MNSQFLNEIAEDCKAAEADLGTDTGPRVVTYLDVDYECAPSLIRRGTTVVVGGREVEIRLTLRIRNKGDDWNFASSPPKSGATVIYQTVTYRIAQVNHAHGAFMEWDLMDANR